MTVLHVHPIKIYREPPEKEKQEALIDYGVLLDSLPDNGSVIEVNSLNFGHVYTEIGQSYFNQSVTCACFETFHAF